MKLKTPLTLTLFHTFGLILAQEQLPIILRAMQDEQQRSMKELKLEGHESPFYISYGINDMKSYVFSASLGALVKSDSGAYRKKNTRVLVGDYNFNDESLDNNIYLARTPNEIDLPLEDDYAGIRRSLWATTDGIYRSAAKHFKENQNTLKEKEKPLSELPHRSFARVQPQQINRFKKFNPINQHSLETYVKELSGFFKDKPGITSSKVILNINRGHQYFANTEGTWYITPIEVIHLSISASTGFGWLNTKQMSRYYTSVDLLPSVNQFTDLNEFLNSINNKQESKTTEDYTGPVLFTNQSVAEVFMTLFMRDGLMADNNLDIQNRYRMENPGAFENKIGKQVTAEAMTIKAKSKMKTFGDIQLLGSYEIDDEGVAPPDEVVLINNGVLTNLLNDRSLTKPDQQANGHANGPGVIEITFQEGYTVEALRKMLINKAKEEGNEYAYITRDASFGRLGGMGGFGGMGMGMGFEGFGDMGGFGRGLGFEPLQFIRIEVATGKEEVVNDIAFKNIAIKNFKKVHASKGGLKAYNLPAGFGGRNMISVICPEALLLEGLDLTPNRIIEPDNKENIFVDPPKP